jgi:copper(I)-binding protein
MPQARIFGATLFSAALLMGLIAACRKSAAVASEGQQLYATNGCASCHGEDGKGDGPLAATLTVRPANLTDASHFRQGTGEDAIAHTLAAGVPNPKSPNTPFMPGFENLSDRERHALAQYIISLNTHGVEARDAWARVPAPSSLNTVAYMTLVNHSGEPRAVISVASDDAATVEMHEMKRNGAMMSMGQVQRIQVPANGSVTLAPDGLHLMLFNLKRRPVVGDTLTITLSFADGSSLPVTAAVRAN